MVRARGGGRPWLDLRRDAQRRRRFENDAESLAAWESASNVRATPHPAEEKPESAAPPPIVATIGGGVVSRYAPGSERCSAKPPHRPPRARTGS
jgi:hypothetical protein